MQFTINSLIALTMVLATSVEAKKGLHGKGFTGDGVSVSLFNLSVFKLY